jgi:hypothetical protein
MSDDNQSAVFTADVIEATTPEAIVNCASRSVMP